MQENLIFIIFFLSIKLLAFQVNLLPEMPSEVVYLTNACVHSKTKSCSWMSEQTGMFMKQIQIFFPILEDFAIQQE